MSRGFRRARVRRADGAVAVATFAPVESALLCQFVRDLMLLLQAETGTAPGGVEPSTDDDVFATLQLDGVGDTAQVPRPEDDVVARLLPDAYRDDDEGAADFRRFTQDRLVAAKHAAAMVVLDSLAAAGPDDGDEHDIKVRLDAAAARQWLRALNDLRLALGTRLGVEQDDDETWGQLRDDDPRTAVHEIYQWLGWLQETLVVALVP